MQGTGFGIDHAPSSGSDPDFAKFMEQAMNAPRHPSGPPQIIEDSVGSWLGVGDHYDGEIVPRSTPGVADDKVQDAGDTDDMTQNTDYRHELQLRDDQLRRDMAAHRELAEERAKAQEERIASSLSALDGRIGASIAALDERIASFVAVQTERDIRIEEISARATKAAESAATVKANYWAAVGVQLLAVAAILVGAYFATQANTLSAITTTLSAYQAGKADGPPPPSPQAAPK
nr:hypothetical protein [Pseudomonas typographi]